VDGVLSEQFKYSPKGEMQSHSTFDQRGNLRFFETFDKDGNIEFQQHCRVEELKKGDLIEEILYCFQTGVPPWLIGQSQPESKAEKMIGRKVSLRHGDVVAEESSYDCNNSLTEKKTFDEMGRLVTKELTSAESNTFSSFDKSQRLLEVQLFRKGDARSSSVEPPPERTKFRYDEAGNLVEMTTESAGEIIRRTVNSYTYDSLNNWITCTEIVSAEYWQIEPFRASLETTTLLFREITYLPF
jgi:YD repeat-containing protein